MKPGDHKKTIQLLLFWCMRWSYGPVHRAPEPLPTANGARVRGRAVQLRKRNLVRSRLWPKKFGWGKEDLKL